MALHALRLRLARLPFAFCARVQFRNILQFVTDKEEIAIEAAKLEDEEIRFQGEMRRVCEKGTGFPLNRLPAELFVQVLEQLVLLYLVHPRKTCWKLHQILELRHVSKVWAKEILLYLHSNITYANLPPSLTFRFISSSSPSISHRQTVLASALYNSSISLHNRHVGSKLVKDVLLYAAHATSLSSRPALSNKEILRRLCTEVSQRTTALCEPCPYNGTAQNTLKIASLYNLEGWELIISFIGENVNVKGNRPNDVGMTQPNT